MFHHLEKKIDRRTLGKQESLTTFMILLLLFFRLSSDQTVLENHNPVLWDNNQAETVSHLVRQERLATIPFSKPYPFYSEMTLANVTQMTLQCYI